MPLFCLVYKEWKKPWDYCPSFRPAEKIYIVHWQCAWCKYAILFKKKPKTLYFVYSTKTGLEKQLIYVFEKRKDAEEWIKKNEERFTPSRLIIEKKEV